MVSSLRHVLRGAVLLLSVLTTAADPAVDGARPPESVLTDLDQDLGSWARSYAAGTATLQQGREIVADRALVLRELASRNPAAVLAAALNESRRAELPAEIQPLLEQPVSTMGDLKVMSVCLRDGRSRLEREVLIEGKSYPVVSYGRRLYQLSKRNLPLQGLLIDGIFVLSEDAIQLIDQAPAGAQVIDTETILDPATAVLGQSGGAVYRFPSAAKAKEAEAAIRDQERLPGPILHRSARDIIMQRRMAAIQVGTPEWTTGNKKVLVIRVDYADAPGDPKWNSQTFPLSKMQDVMDNQVAPFYANSSFHQLSLTTTITKVYRMKDPVADYAKALVKVMRDEALAAAKVDYPGPYDLTIIVTTDLGYYPDTNYTFSGVAYLGESGVIVNGAFTASVVTHELGHNLGLHHANLWTVTDGNPMSPNGSSTEYGDIFDVMGDNVTQNANHDFSAGEKYQIRWLSDGQVKHLTEDGTYRIYGADHPERGPNDLVALKVVKDPNRTYWISYRPNFRFGSARTTNITEGAYIVWQSEQLYGQQNLLDMITPGNTPADAALPIGDTFNDPDIGLTVETIAKGGAGSRQFLDVRIGLKNYIQITSSPSNQTIDPDDDATFTITVANTDATYQWQVSTDGGVTWAQATGSQYNGGQTSRLTVLAVTADADLHLFRCQVTVRGQTVNSRSATLKVGAPPTITNDIGNVSLSVRPGETATLTVGVTGRNVFYSWYRLDGDYRMTFLLDEGPYSGTTTNTLTIRGEESLNGVSYFLIAANAYGSVQSGRARLRVKSPTNHLVNLSTRCRVGTGDSIGIIGLVIRQRSTVLLRAVGPSLKSFGIGDPLPRPVLKLIKGQNVAATNSGWKTAGAAEQRIIQDTGQRLGAFALTDDADSVLIPVLEPGIYTVHISDANDRTGVALIEAYLDKPAGTADDHFSNLSSRIYVGRGDDLGIAGLVLEQPATVLIRAVGPSLASFGVSNVLQKPVMRLVKDGTVVATNSGWRSSDAQAEKLSAAALTCGAFPLTSPDDSALLIQLTAGNYTALVSGANDTTGNALIEVYLVD